MIGLFELARIRQERAGKKYVLENGQNAAMYRNNCLDIMEELADAWNILTLLDYRLMKVKACTPATDRIIAQIFNAIDTASRWVDALEYTIPEDMRRDLIEVERILPEN